MSDTDTTLWALSTAGTEALEERPASAVAPTTVPGADAHLQPAARTGNESATEAPCSFYGPI